MSMHNNCKRKNIAEAMIVGDFQTTFVQIWVLKTNRYSSSKSKSENKVFTVTIKYFFTTYNFLRSANDDRFPDETTKKIFRKTNLH